MILGLETELRGIFIPTPEEFAAAKHMVCAPQQLQKTMDIFRAEGIKLEPYLQGILAFQMNRVNLVFSLASRFLANNPQSPFHMDIPLNLYWDYKYSITGSAASTIPIFVSQSGTFIEKQDLPQAIEANDVRLNEVAIVMNLPHMIEQLEQYWQLYTQAMAEQQAGVYSGPNPNKLFAYAIEEESIEREAGIVEELAHAFYIQHRARTHHGLRKFVEEFKTYDPNVGESYFHSSDDLFALQKIHETYTDTVPELRAGFWRRAYVRRFYPHSMTMYHFDTQRAAQKLRHKYNRE